MPNSNVTNQARQTDFKQARLLYDLREQDKRILGASQEAIALLNREKDITPVVIRFFNLLHQNSRMVYDGVLFVIRQTDVGLANDLLSQTGVGISFAEHGQLFYISGPHYVVKNMNSGATVMLTNFSVVVHGALWFSQEQETWFEGSVKMGYATYPIFFSTKHLAKIDNFLDICRAAIYTNDTIRLLPPTVLVGNHTKNILRLLAWQTQCVTIQMGVSQLGWTNDRTTFVAPGWIGKRTGTVSNFASPHPRNALFKTCYDFKSVTAESFVTPDSHTNSFISVLVALLRRSYHGWNYPELLVYHNETSELIIREIFRVFGQTRSVNVGQLSGESHLSGYPVFTIGNTSSKSSVPAFRLQDTGVVVPVRVLSLNEQRAIGPYTFEVMNAIIPFIIKENVTGIAKTDVNFFDLCAEGKLIIDSCFKMPIAVRYGNNTSLWQYLSEIPANNIQTHILLNLTEQKIYFNFHRIRIKRKLVKHALSELYPAAESEMHGNRYIKLNAVEGLELLRNFYGPELRISQVIKAQNSEEDGDSEEVNSAQIGV